MESLEERMAKVEVNAVHNTATLEEVRSDVKEIKRTLNRQRGFIAGMMCVIAPLWIAILTFVKAQWDKMVS